MSAWLSKWAPVCGTVAGVLAAIASFASPDSPGDDTSGAPVMAWYNSNHTSDFVFDLIGGLAVLFLVFFAVAWPGRSAPVTGGWPTGRWAGPSSAASAS
jgi:hypothetical protein